MKAAPDIDVEPRGRHAFALLFLLGGLAAVTWCLMYVAPLSVAACNSRCDYVSLATAVNAYLVAAPLVVLLAAAVTPFLRRRGWWVVTPAAVGIVVLVALFWILSETTQTAMLLN
ncbi:hypothetical protein [Microbacterium kunmingense]|uniref:hypothetical protein n=1 Tax=Microbacterium kunmingense TaxID=2915939 RepID=UPI003D744C2F